MRTHDGLYFGHLGQADTVPVMETDILMPQDAKYNKVYNSKLTILIAGKPFKTLDADRFGEFTFIKVELPAGTDFKTVTGELSAPGKITVPIPNVVCNTGSKNTKTGETAMTMNHCGSMGPFFLLAPGEENPGVARARDKRNRAYIMLGVGIGALVGVGAAAFYLVRKKS